MKLAILILTFASLASAREFITYSAKGKGDCSTSCYSSINIPFDAEGSPAPTDAGPGYWGTQGAALTRIAFEDVPEGYQVRLLRVKWNLTAWVHGVAAPGGSAGVLWALQDSESLGPETSNVQYGTNGCFLYSQMVVGSNTVPPIQADTDLSKEGVVFPDGVMWSKEAVWLNDTGKSVHVEATFVVTYQFFKP